ncbi:hypothetical protein FPV16_08260 [Methylobacterium sp. W2]|uniref:hypothetical protein n=1 Tax=Methylobacterium sp. W2 TaxID=2598107 RepID=UPI001D0CABFC|nr:hypothetical protein [Methylobacterium sp. W2]MCC0806204.1 hypothetical protein [Methylobacterium sp. W2]
MAKNDHKDRLKLETTETNGKIAEASEKLAIRFRAKSQKADEKAQAAGKKGKQEVLRRRSELFGQAAKELEDKVAKLRKTAA